jgi:hypothetical protein
MTLAKDEAELRELKLIKSETVLYLEEYFLNKNDIDDYSLYFKNLGNLQYEIIQLEKKIIRQTENLIDK